jgi:Bacterial Ig-like domain/WD40-like Beta Propeller Repeat
MTGRERGYPHGEWDDTEDPALAETAGLVHRVLHSDQMHPAFRDRLRAQIVAARAQAIRNDETVMRSEAGQADQGAPRPAPPVPPTQRPAPRRRVPRHPAAQRPAGRAPRRRRVRPAALGWLAAATATAAAAVVFAVVGLPTLRGTTGAVTVAVRSDVNGTVSADPGAAIRLTFTQPVDHDSTRAAVNLTPFVSTMSQWQGDTLVVKPSHGFAPNTGYLLTIDHTVARTANGAALASDLRVAFGTAPRPGVGPPPAAPVSLHRTPVGGARDGSEAVVARDGSLLLTEATGDRRGMLRVTDHGAQRLSGDAGAICVSRSGDSIAYLAGSGSETQVVFADSVGTPQGHRPVDIDDGSPLGWINDDRVTYVSHGQLVAIDRHGNRQTLPARVDVAHDAFVIAPGGGYAYVEKQGVIALSGPHQGAAHPLPGIAGQPAFSADGATVIWIDNSTGTPRLSVAPSAGGPVFTANLPHDVKTGDRIGDLSVSPDGSRLVYSLDSGGHKELRLASLPDGDTLAVSAEGAGESPNWSPSGHTFTVLSGASGQGTAHIDTITLPQAVRDPGAALDATASAFADAQLSDDTAAQRSLTAPGVALPSRSTAATRAAVVYVAPNGDGTATALVRLTADPTFEHPAARQTEETLTLGVPRPGALPKVLKVTGGQQFQPAPGGPQLVDLDTDAVPGSILLTFDSDLDPNSLNGIRLYTPDGKAIAARPDYDGVRGVTLTPASRLGTLTVRIDHGLRDAKGNPLERAAGYTIALEG